MILSFLLIHRIKRALTKQDLSLSIIVSAPHLFSTLTSALLDECVFFYSLLSFLFSLLTFLVMSQYLFSEALGDFIKYFRVLSKAVGCLKFTVSLSGLLNQKTIVPLQQTRISLWFKCHVISLAFQLCLSTKF